MFAVCACSRLNKALGRHTKVLWVAVACLVAQDVTMIVTAVNEAKWRSCRMNEVGSNHSL